MLIATLLLLAGAAAVAVFYGRQTRLLRAQVDQAAVRQSASAAQQHSAQRTLESFEQIAGEIVAALADPPHLPQELCRITARSLDCPCSWVVVRDASSGFFTPAAVHGIPGSLSDTLTLLRIPPESMRGLLSRLARDGIVRVRSVPEGERIARVAGDYGIGTHMYVPLRCGDDVFGIVAAGFLGDGAFSAAQEQTFLALAKLAAVALEVWRLHAAVTLSERERTRFVGRVSQLLRTPLDVIREYHELLLDGAFGEIGADQRDPLRRAAVNAIELQSSLDAVLDLSTVHAPSVVLNLEDIDALSLLEPLRKGEIALRQPSPGVRIDWNVAADLPPIRTDVAKARALLRNLLDNAIKFTANGTITVGIVSSDGGIELSVRDTGIGFPAEARERIFVAFETADDTIGERYGGAGLGLHIVARIVEVLGGRIEAESEIGRGSRFRVWLPRQQQATD